MAHLDVVPVIKENRARWKQAPFGRDIINDTLWGRGTIDNKVGVIGIMESLELLLNEKRITIKKGTFVSEPSKVSSTSSFGYKILKKNISKI